MKKLMFGIFSFSLILVKAHALDVYNCDFTVKSWTKKTLLIPNITNKQTFNKTKLAMTVNRVGKLSGSVNGQPNFIIKGTVASGSFQSAYDKGTVRCEAAEKVDYLLRFNPWGQFFTLDPSLGQGHILNSIDFAQVRYGNICFIGDVKATGDAITKYAGLKAKIVSPYTLSFTQKVTDCAAGYGGIDDWTCTRYRTQTITKTINHCFESDSDRP